MPKNRKVRLVISVIFVFGLFGLAYWLLNENIKMIFEPEAKKNDDGKGIQYRFAYTGKGDKINIISLNKGASLFEYFHEGDGDFYADIKTSDGKLLKVLAQTKGNYEGKTEIEIPNTDAYIVSIKTAGNWGLDFK